MKHQSLGQDSPGEVSHAVQFYEDEAVFLDSLGEFVGSALGAGGACIVIATRNHLDGLAERLRQCGIDLSFAIRNDRYITREAADMLSKFMVDGWPDEDLFYRLIAPLLLRARTRLPRKPGAVVAFGEMVALLWSQGKCEAAIRLEQLWNDITRRHSFSVRCAYPINFFGGDSQSRLFQQVCAEHNSVIPTESYTALDTEEDRSRLVSSLQQKAQTVQATADEREREIARRKRVEEELRLSEEFARTVIESSADSVILLDLDGRIKYISSPGQRALEIEDTGQFLGSRWVNLWKEEDRPRAEAAVKAALSGTVCTFQGDSFTVGGLPKSWDVKISPVTNSDGTIERLIVVARDITELKCAQIAVMQAEQLAATGRMAATMAHEINNPLEAVTNFIYLAKTDPGVPDEVRGQLEIADQELARVAQIAQQTLGFYRDNSSHGWVRVAQVVGEVVAVYERKSRYKRIEIEVSVDSGLKLHVRQGELKQALGNLIANAIDASNIGGKLWLRAHAARNWKNAGEPGVRFTLADNGSGMSPEVQRRIFMPFFTTKADVGTGIGLWMTKGLIEKQGGTLRFRSRQGAHPGTVMSFFLPHFREDRISGE